ncbi:MAG: AAA family ATPase [Candidatus Bathyarchaeia archaeon]
MPMICFFGPDGSGKSTLARAIAKKLVRNEFKIRISWIRGTHTLAFLIARFLYGFNAFKGLDNPYYGIKIPGKMITLWCLLEFASVLPVFFARYLLPSLVGGYTVIGERGLLDFVVWTSMVTHNHNFARNLLGRVAIAIASKYSFNIYLKADISTLRIRKRDSTPDLLKYQLRIYDSLAKALKTPIVDTTNKKVEESIGEILYYIAQRLKI